jgi:deoxyadenosine/deoxycytidine kinase
MLPSTKILSIEEGVKDHYYDFHVPGTNCYWAGGVWHHNSGKSIFSYEIGRRLGLRVLKEPKHERFLRAFYAEPKKYALGLQYLMLHRRYALQQLASYESTGVGGHQGVILDRSLSGDRVFAKMHRDEGNISELDWEAYESAHAIMARTLLPPTLLVFLDVQPEVCFARMNGRGRDYEGGVTLEYLQKLRRGYLELLREAEHGLLPWGHAIKVTTLLWNQDTLTPEQWDATAASIKEMCAWRGNHAGDIDFSSEGYGKEKENS